VNNLETMSFLGRCLAPGRHDLTEVLTEQISTGTLDWKRLVLIASGHYLAPSLCLALKRRGLWDLAPTESRECLQAMELLNRERNAIHFEQMVAITRQLNSAGIKPLLLKGAICLLPGQFPEAEGRVLYDLDLLIPKHRIEECIQALAKLGYGFQPRAVHSRFEKRQHLAPLFHADFPVRLEIHRDASPGHVKPIFTTEDMWQTARIVEFSGAHAFVPDNPMRLMHNVVHIRLYHKHHQDFVLDMRQLNEWVQLCDFYEAEIDLHRIWDQFNQHGQATALETYMLAASRFFDQPLPPGIHPSRAAHRFEKVMCLALRIPALWTVLNRDRYLIYPKKLLSPSWYRRKYKELRAGQAWWGVFR
jgi:hypothetical protein